MSKKSAVAASSDLDSHVGKDWQNAHGIWEHIRPKVPSREDAYINVYLASDHTGLTATGWEQVLFDTETEDAAGLFGSSLFTAPAAGLYLIEGTVSVQNNGAAAQKFRVGIYKNGSLLVQCGRDDEVTNGGYARGLPVQGVHRLAAGDTIGIWIYCSTANNMKILGGATLTWLTIAMLR